MDSEMALSHVKVLGSIQFLPASMTPDVTSAELVIADVADDDDDLHVAFDPSVSKADRTDYILAACSGTLTGVLNIFWQKEFDIEKAHEWGSEKVDSFVIEVAKGLGLKKQDPSLGDAIRFLEERFPIAADKLTAPFGGGLQHHLRDFSHHPSPVGLVCSILTQFTSRGYGTDTDGVFRSYPLSSNIVDLDPPLIGRTFSEKIVLGTVFWALHLVSDMAGSSANPGKGTGIPGPLLSILKELSSLPLFHNMARSGGDHELSLSQWIAKLFNGTAIITEDGRKVRFDLRTEIGLLDQALSQVKAVVANECIVRSLYFLSRLKDELVRCEVSSLSDLNKMNPSAFLPYKSRALTRMLTVSTGTFVLTNVSSAFIRAAIDAKVFDKNFARGVFLRLNYAGMVRFAFAISSDAQYIAEDVVTAWKEREEKEREIFDSFKFFRLENGESRLAYSLRLGSVLDDIRNTSDERKAAVKRQWMHEWMDVVAADLNVEPGQYFLLEHHSFEALEQMASNDKGYLKALLIVQEVLDFVPYGPLNSVHDEQFKKVSYDHDWMRDAFCDKQDAIDKETIKLLRRRKVSYARELSGTIPKLVTGGVLALAVTVGTAGAASVFAPQIAVALAGSSFVGLHGAALASASLAALGGGALAAGGLGMAGGTAIITGGGAILGLIGSGGIMLASSLGKDYAKIVLAECSKMLAYIECAGIERPRAVNELILNAEEAIQSSVEENQRAIEEAKQRDDAEKAAIKQLKAGVRYLQKTAECLEKMTMQNVEHC